MHILRIMIIMIMIIIVIVIYNIFSQSRRRRSRSSGGSTGRARTPPAGGGALSTALETESITFPISIVFLLMKSMKSANTISIIHDISNNY